MRLSPKAAKRLAVVIVCVPIVGWAAFMAYTAYFSSVTVPESEEFQQVEAFVRSSPEVAREFGQKATIKRGDRFRVRTVGSTKDGYFSFEIAGPTGAGGVDAHWIVRSPRQIEVLELRKQIPWHDSVVIFKKEPIQPAETTRGI